MIHPINDTRWGTTNIKLAAIVAACGFKLKAAQPAEHTMVVDPDANPGKALEGLVNRQSRPRGDMTSAFFFYFEPKIDPEEARRMEVSDKLTANMFEAAWVYPDSYTVEGFEAELPAMRKALEAREWLVKVIHGNYQLEPRNYRGKKWSTESLHVAAVVKASGIDVLEFRDRVFYFPGSAQDVGRITHDASPDHLIRWQLAAIYNGDRLLAHLRNPKNIPMVELRRGERIARFSKDLPRNNREELMEVF